MNRKIIFWLLSCFLITLFSGLVYISVQQSLRLSANDPQIQIAEDVANSLNEGANPNQLSPTQLDMRKSLAPFVIIYDNSGKVLANSGALDGKAPILPKGVLDFAKAHGENRLSWQPASGVREAAVVVKYKNGFVLSARSLSEVEKREDLVFHFALLAWAIGVAASTLVFLLLTRPGFLPAFVLPKKSSRSKK